MGCKGLIAVGSDYEQISQAVATRKTGMGVGALFGGWLMTKLTRFNDLILALCLTIGVLGVGIAYTTYLQAMYLEFTIQGIAETFIAITGQQSLIKLWKEKSDSPMHILHCGYGAGSFLVPQIVKPFLSTRIALFSVACVSGFFVGPLYPTGIAWANRYITLTGVGYTLTLLGGAAAGVSFTVAIGWFFENTGPQPMLYFVVGYSALACSLAIFMHLVARTRGDKYERERRNRTSDTVELSSKD
ncbi:major facilitator superfamily domain-containing protein 4A-like [Watersipora subatra]|uniref:major facilitator superfamily domain-containing protein 4A-like n=1 Tax=Watersipora subatra TaxID=2589382 RepID=UPI00355B5234